MTASSAGRCRWPSVAGNAPGLGKMARDLARQPHCLKITSRDVARHPGGTGSARHRAHSWNFPRFERTIMPPGRVFGFV